MKDNTELYNISLLQFLGPIFVIMGHSLNGDILMEGAWWYFTKSWIYSFHMPLFFAISGYLIANNKWLGQRTYKEFVRKKIKRLIVPYLFLNILFFALELVLFEKIDWYEELINIFFFPKSAVLGHTWFLVAIFLLYLLVPVCEKIYNWCNNMYRTIVLFIILVGIWFLQIDTYFMCLLDIRRNLVYFFGGMLFFKFCNIDDRVVKSKAIFWSDVLFVIFISYLRYQHKYEKMDIILALFILWGLFQFPIVFDVKNTVISALAKESMIIYLLHWPCMYFFKLIFWDKLNSHMVVFIICEMTIGYVVPLLFIKFVDIIKNYKVRRCILFLLGR